MKHVEGNIYEHDGIVVEKIGRFFNDKGCLPCPFFGYDKCPECTSLIGDKVFRKYEPQEKKVMKKEELSFKVITGSRDRNIKIVELAIRKGIEVLNRLEIINTAMAILIKNSALFFWSNPMASTFDHEKSKEVVFQEAVKLIESIEPDAPEFDIKLLEPVLTRNGGADSFWNLAFFAAVKSNGLFANNGYCREMIKLAGNESFMLERNTPAGWWECENGKPVWKTK